MIRNEGIKQVLKLKLRHYKSCLGKIVRECSVYTSLLVSLVFLALDTISVYLNVQSPNPLNKNIISQLGFTIVLFLFAICDGIYHLHRQRYYTYVCCSKTENRSGEKDNKDFCRETCTCLPKWCTTAMDVVRIFFVEMIFYPQLLLKMFAFAEEVVHDDIHNEGISTITYLQFLASILGKVLLVYITRMLVLGESIWSIQKFRKAHKEKFHWDGASFHILFVAQAYGQMLIEMVMIVAIGLRYYTEYGDEYNAAYETFNATNNESFYYNYSPSGQLWYMMGTAYVSPALGLVMFLLVHHFWTQKFPIDLMLHMMEVLQAPGIMGSLNVKKNVWHFEDVDSKIMKAVDDAGDVDHITEEHYEDIQALHSVAKSHHTKFNGSTWAEKVLHPFLSPLIVLLCLLYAAMMAAFWLCAIIINGATGSWITLYTIGVFLVLAINYYTMAVAIVWTVILPVAASIGLAIIIIYAPIHCCPCTRSYKSNYKVND